LRLGLAWLPLEFVLDVVRGRHEGDVGHRLRLKPHDARVDLGIDAAQQRPHIEVEQGAVGRYHAVGLGPWGQGIEGALLQRLHHLGARRKLGREICFRQSARRAKIPE
jgi:hypothetical protein